MALQDCEQVTLGSTGIVHHPNANLTMILTLTLLVAWHSGRTTVFGRRTFPVQQSTCS